MKPMTKAQKAALLSVVKAETDFMEELVTWLYNNRDVASVDSYFDFPDYGGMPPSLHGQLTSATVDRIQDNWNELRRVRSPVRILEWFWDIA